MKYDLFVSDFDGTLGTVPDIIDEETLKAVKEYVRRGGKFAVCSGRMASSIRPICLKYGLEGVVVSYQGAMIHEIETGKLLFSGGLDADISAELAEYFIKAGMPVVADIDDVMFYQGRCKFIEDYEKNCKVKGFELSDIASYIRAQGKKINKMLGMCGYEMAKSETEKLAAKYCGRVTVNNGAPHLVECVSPKCGKKFGVEFLADYYGIPHDKIIAVGDSTNDIELLSGGWKGVAVGDGREELKAVADEITVPFKDKPVKYLLEKYCL